MALIKSRFRMTEGDAVNVLDFGASPSAADTVNFAAFQAAIDTGRSVFVPAGDFEISGTLTVTTEGQRIYGVGRTSRILHTSETGNLFELGTSGADPTTGLTFENLTVAATTAKSAGAMFRGRRVNQCQWLNVHIGAGWGVDSLVYDGINIQSGTRLFIDENCEISAVNRGVVVAGQYIDSAHVWGAELTISGRLIHCGVGVHCTGAFGGLYLNGEISVCNVGVSIDATAAYDADYNVVPSIANREIFLTSQCIIDACHDYNVLLESGSAAIVDFIGTWVCSAGQIAPMTGQGVGIYAAPGFNGSVRMTGVRLYNNRVTGANLAGGAVSITGSTLDLNGTAVEASLGANGLMLSANLFRLNTTGISVGAGFTVLHVADNAFIANGTNMSNGTGWSGGGIHIRHNSGLITENQSAASGTTSGAGDLTVTHGLVTTPTSVVATVVSAGDAVAAVHALGASTFAVRVTIGGTPLASTAVAVSWSARV